MRSALANHRQGQWKELNNPRPPFKGGSVRSRRGGVVSSFCIESALGKVPLRQLNFQGERQCLPLHIDGSPQYTLPLPPPTAAQKGEKYSSYKTSTFFYTLPPPAASSKNHKKVENIRVLLLSYFCPFSRTQEQQILMLEMKSKSMTSMDHLIYQKGR